MFKILLQLLFKKKNMDITNIDAVELKKLIKENRDNLEIIDVREQQEYDIIRIKGSKFIPMNQVQDRVDDIDWNKDVVLYCLSGSRSRMIAMLLGKPVKNLTNGLIDIKREWGFDDEELEVDKSMISMYL